MSDIRSRATPIEVALAMAFIALGVAYRLVLYRSNPLLSLDEAMLALNVVRRDWRGLLSPLALQQIAPVLFLWAIRLAVVIGGVTTYALRAVPLLAGLAVIPLVWYAARDLVGPSAAWVAAAVAALAPLGMAYGSIVKQYSVDAAVTALLIVLALAVVRGVRGADRWWLAASAITPFLSTPSVFVNLACLIAVWMAAGRRATRATVTVGIVWLAAVAVNFLLFQRTAADDPYLHYFWAQAFPRLPLAATLRLLRLRAGFMMQGLFTGYIVPYPTPWRWVLLLLTIVGVVHITRLRGRWAAILLAGPIVAVGIAATFRAYPLADRTLQFATPLLIVAMVGALDAVVAFARPAWRTAVFAAAALVIVVPDAVDLIAYGLPLHDRRTDADLAAVWRHAQAGEPVYIFSLDVPRWAFYTTDWAHPDTARVDSLVALASRLGPNSGNQPSRLHAVHGEGRQLVLRTGGRTELIGVPTGMQILPDGPTRLAPDSGWTTNEAERVRAVAVPSAWLVFLNGRGVSPGLVDTLRADGGLVTDSLLATGLKAYQYQQTLGGETDRPRRPE